MDLLNRISGKLNMYNEAVRGLRGMEGLRKAKKEEVGAYEEWVRERGVVVEGEMGFLKGGDLVAVGPAELPPVDPSPSPPQPQPQPQHHHPAQSTPDHSAQTLVLAVAASFIVPVLTFAVIPNFAGRMAVAVLVAVGILGMVVLAEGGRGGGLEGMGLGARERVVCVGVWVVGMVVVGGLVG